MYMHKKITAPLCLTFVLFLSACGEDGFLQIPGSNTANESSPKPNNPQICSKLEFPNYNWPQEVFDYEIDSFKIALNITSTFEGPDQWRNLTNNFDGQGLSMGLLNQTLGTNSLQPLLIKARDKHMDVLKNSFSPSRLNSLLGMLRKWERLKASEDFSERAQQQEGPFSPLDIGYNDNSVRISSASSDSVSWAKRNLYKWNGDFIPEWRDELQKFIGTPEYIGIQLEAAWLLHKKTLKLFEMTGVPQLRSYLLMFDVVIQNGNMYMQDWIDYEKYLEENPQATDTERLTKLVELRLRKVKPQYVNNVRIRKMSLIHGTGRVHGQNREYEKEFCFDRMMELPAF